MTNKKPELKLHLYFHDDFDGVAAAAILTNFIESRGGKALSFNPVDYNPRLKPKWADFRFKRPFAILDFLYHPKASWWFDHHRTSFIRRNWQDKFKSDKTHVFGPAEKSACDLLIRRLKKDFDYKPPKFITDLAKWATIIDSASYKSAKEAVRGKGLTIKLAKALNPMNFEGNAGAKYFETVIKSLAGEPIAKTLRMPVVKKEIKRIEKSDKEVNKIFKKISTVVGKAVFVDGTKTKAQLSNYFGYYFYPKIDYTVTLEFYGNYYHLSIGKNPWKKTLARIHIGKMLQKHGGGGHKTVGGVERKTKPEILKIAEEIIKYLNKHG